MSAPSIDLPITGTAPQVADYPTLQAQINAAFETTWNAVLARATTDALAALVDDLGALAELDQVGTAQIEALSVTGPKLAALAVTNGKLGSMPALTIKGNLVADWSAPQDLTAEQVATFLGLPDALAGKATAAQGELAVTAVQPGSDATAGNGFLPVLTDVDGLPWLAWDQAREAMRMPGGPMDRAEAVPGALWAGLAGGVPVVSVGLDGRVYGAVSATAPMVWSAPVDDGAGAVHQVFMADGASARRLTASPVDCYAPELAAPGVIRFARADGRVATVRGGIGGVAGGEAIEMVAQHGQSLALGSVSYAAGTAPVTQVAPGSTALMFNGGVLAGVGLASASAAKFTSLVPALDVVDMAIAGGTIGATGLPGLGFGLASEAGARYLVAATGQGGTGWDALKKGTVPWENLIYGVTRGKALADAQSASFRLAALRIVHGESAETETTAQYRARLIEAQGDITSDVGAITGQTVPPAVIYQQINRMEATPGGSGLAAFRLDNPGAAAADLVASPVPGLLITGPQYVAEFGDQFHMLPEWYCVMSALAAKALRRFRQSGVWRPLHMVSASLRGRHVVLRFDGGNIPMGGQVVLDRALVTDPGRCGFVWRDSTMSASVIDVSVTGRAEITLTLSALPTGTAPEVGLAFYGPTENDTQGRASGLRSCVRDTDAEGCPVTGRPLFNFAISQAIGVSA